MPTKTINGRLEIDISHPWDRPEPIKQVDPHENCLPTEDEILGILEELLEHDYHLIPTLLTYYDPENFLTDGNRYVNADIPGNT